MMADVAVAQAALESGYGTGQLAQTGNNFHSIKAGDTWTGPTASFQDDEVGPSSFRTYDNPADSYKDWKSVIEKNFPDVVNAKSLPEAIAALKEWCPWEICDSCGLWH
jgi:N-acetylmuramoyl-L-alanine amidase